MGYDLRAPCLLLHSFQAPAAWDELARTGCLRAEEQFIDSLDFTAYRWIADELARVTGQTWRWPIWSWARITRRALVSEARRYTRMDPGTVLLTLRVPARLVLLSKFSDWHCVLNQTPVPRPNLTDDELDRFYDAWYDRLEVDLPQWRTMPRAGWPKSVTERLRGNWPQILDTESYPRRSWWQACLTEIRAEHVIGAVELR
ncbi:DUF3841 domain-containing protein [Isoptericola sp. b490]|uniref:DUF3841 domain-containing protein n=1 Tax=Actinotalea lenta TaxID=3064654 RepID=UPI0027136F94|nr:DUF3841 domain-containing protein [Isoptericola sp. b490]MDO8119691.1 DUF3841 domain-containing protein [Isoptericola sp. b490]